jgi:hypothetical protein
MALSPNVWAFAFLYLAASVGTGVNNTVHNSYLSDAYPTEGGGGSSAGTTCPTRCRRRSGS